MKINSVSKFISLFMLAVCMLFSASSGFAQSAESGSVVLFSDYVSKPTLADCDDTFFSLTNSHPSQRAFVRVLFVNRIDLSAEEYAICLPALQSVRWRASEMDPGVSGFAYAIVTDAAGRPSAFNWLSGTFSRMTNSRQEVWRSAISLKKLSVGAVMPVNGVSTISFDGQMYSHLPSHLADIFPEVSVAAFTEPVGCVSKFTSRRNSVTRE
jgi:hypothetical protein